ncbi:hypothetical protein STEG23_007540, partial [Scotinomys teguina]
HYPRSVSIYLLKDHNFSIFHRCLYKVCTCASVVVNRIKLQMISSVIIEIEKFQGSDGKKEDEEKKYLDVISNKNIKLSERVLIPVKQYPKNAPSADTFAVVLHCLELRVYKYLQLRATLLSSTKLCQKHNPKDYHFIQILTTLEHIAISNANSYWS